MKRIKQINNMIIKLDNAPDMVYFGNVQKNPLYGSYSVYAPDGRCLEDRLTLEQAEELCNVTTDFIKNGKE